MPRKAPPEFDENMTAGDIADELRRLKFDHGNYEFHRIKIDEQVRDYLVASLSARHAARRA